MSQTSRSNIAPPPLYWCMYFLPENRHSESRLRGTFDPLAWFSRAFQTYDSTHYVMYYDSNMLALNSLWICVDYGDKLT